MIIWDQQRLRLTNIKINTIRLRSIAKSQQHQVFCSCSVPTPSKLMSHRIGIKSIAKSHWKKLYDDRCMENILYLTIWDGTLKRAGIEIYRNYDEQRLRSIRDFPHNQLSNDGQFETEH